MTKFTDPYNLPKPESSDKIASPVTGEALRIDLTSLADATNRELQNVEARATESINELEDQQIRTEVVENDQMIFEDSYGGQFLVVDDIHRDPHFQGTTPPNTENLPAVEGECLEFVDAFGVKIFTLDYSGGTATSFTETHFIFLLGQSNTFGIGTPSPVGTNNALPNLFTIPQRGASQGVEIRATDPITHPYANPVANSIGYGWTVARQYALENPGVRVVVIGLAKSGSGFWAPSDPTYSWAPSREGETGIASLYRNAITRANDSIASYTGTKRVAMFLWHQGEGDAVGETTNAAYEAELTALINGLRTNVTGAEESIFLIGQLGWEFRNVRAPGTWAQIDEAQQNVPNLVPRTAFASAPPQGHMFEDNTHFTGLGQKLLAESYISVIRDAYYNV